LLLKKLEEFGEAITKHPAANKKKEKTKTMEPGSNVKPYKTGNG
jgi:hypothetical protein